MLAAILTAVRLLRWHYLTNALLFLLLLLLLLPQLQEKRSLEDLGNRIAEAIREKRRVRTRLNNYSASPPPSAVYNAAGASPPGMHIQLIHCATNVNIPYVSIMCVSSARSYSPVAQCKF
eukprot:10740-Heterococcus_DN1.PRE.7